jgi:anti-sigma B factor antagonist
MSFSIGIRSIGNVIVLDMIGRLELGEPTDALRLVVRQSLLLGIREFVFNLAEVDHIDSSGLGALNEMRRAIEVEDGQVRMAALTKRVDDLLVITKLVTVFKTFKDECQAIESLSK